jgi:hypothetical protein
MAENEADEFVSMRVRRKTLNLLKAVSGWRGMSLVDYVDAVVQKAVEPDMRQMWLEFETESMARDQRNQLRHGGAEDPKAEETKKNRK